VTSPWHRRSRRAATRIHRRRPDRDRHGRLAELWEPVRSYSENFPQIPAWRGALIAIAAESGWNDQARAIFEELAVDEFATIPRDFGWLIAMTHLAIGCAALGDRDRAAILHKALLPFAGRYAVVAAAIVTLGPISRSLGLLAQTLGDIDRARQHFEDAIMQAKAIGAYGWAALTELDYSVLLSGQDGGPAIPATASSAGRRPDDGGGSQVVSRVRTGGPTRRRCDPDDAGERKNLA
jgi:hypothetical protein